MLAEDVVMIVLGAGRVGTSLVKRSKKYDIEVGLVGRTDPENLLADPLTGPILVATRNDDLVEVIERVPMGRRRDLIFIQNGMIRSLLLEHGLGGATRGLIYFAATERNGEIQPGRVSYFSGPHAHTMVYWFEQIELAAAALEWPPFTFREFEKLAWLCTMGVLCNAHQCSVGEAVTTYETELVALLDELRSFGGLVFNVDVDPEYLLHEIRSYSLTIPAYRASVKEWKWRNGAVLAALLERGKTLPFHLRLLEAGGHGDKIPPELRRG